MKLIKRLRLSWQLAITVLLAVAMLATPFLGTAAAQATGNAQKGTSFTTVTNSVTDTNSVSQVVYYSQKQDRPDGGTRYIFDINGVQNILHVAPNGFRPATATDAQLAEYGFPARPKDATALATWTSKWSRWVGKRNSSEPVLVVSPFKAEGVSQFSKNWSGYENLQSSRSAYSMVAADFTQPYWNYNSPANALVASWVGLGGNGLNDPLVQCGTMMGWHPTLSGTGSGYYAAGACSAWYCYIPYDSNAIYVLPFTINSSDQISTMTVWNPDYYVYGVPYPATFSVWDWNTMSNFNITVPDPNHTGYDGGTAEVIDERPQIGGTPQNPVYAPLAGFGTNNWSECEANNGDFVDNSTFADYMTSDGTLNGRSLAYPSYPIQIVNGYGSFTDHYVASQ
jgi:hypothetical protein